jgi:C4-dicarboxylate-specific signal transduction histidine kinase
LRFFASFFVITGLVYTIYKNITDFEHLQVVEIPIIELSAENISLNQEIYNSIDYLLIAKKQTAFLTKVKTLKQKLNSNLALYNKKIEKVDYAQKILFSRKKLNILEDQILISIANKEIKSARALFETKKFQTAYFEFTEKIQLYIDELTQARNARIVQYRANLSLIATICVISLIVIIGVWFYIYRNYHQNLTKQIVLEDELHEQQALAFNTSKLASMGEMAAGIAHEINNPLAVIEGSSSTIIRKIEKNEVDFERLKNKWSVLTAVCIGSQVLLKV